MKRTFSYLLVIFGLCSFMTPEEERDWLEYQKSRVEAVGEEPTIEQLSTLVQLVTSPSESERAAIVRELAWQKLLTIPDFPERIRDHFLETRATLKKDHKAPVNLKEAQGILSNLGGVPYPGSVKVLGDFLYDDEVAKFENAEDEIRAVMWGYVPLCVSVARALGQLIESPPLQGDPENYQLHDVATWQLWYEQVKAGTRTFRLKGDPQEYTLAGPVSEARVPLAGADSRRERPIPPTSPAADDGKKGVPVVPLAAAGLLLAVAFWLAIRRKPRAV